MDGVAVLIPQIELHHALAFQRHRRGIGVGPRGQCQQIAARHRLQVIGGGIKSK